MAMIKQSETFLKGFGSIRPTSGSKGQRDTSICQLRDVMSHSLSQNKTLHSIGQWACSHINGFDRYTLHRRISLKTKLKQETELFDMLVVINIEKYAAQIYHRVLLHLLSEFIIMFCRRTPSIAFVYHY